MAVILAILLTVTGWQATDAGWYDGWYRGSNLAARLDVPEKTPEQAMKLMLDYVTGASDTMDGSLPGIGEVYNAREKAHMKDVRRLYQSAMAVRNAAWLVTLAGVLLAAWKQDWKAIWQFYLQC